MLKSCRDGYRSNSIEGGALKVYFGIDGNRIGSRIESALITGDLAGIERLSRDVTRAIQLIEKRVVEAGARVIFIGGDSLFAEMEYDQDLCKELVDIFKQMTGCEAAAGVGRTPLDTFLAVRLAKSSAAAGAPNEVKVYGGLEVALSPVRSSPRHKGLIWLLGPGRFDHLMVAIRHHYSAEETGSGLEHCWLIVAGDSYTETILKTVREELIEGGFDIEIHPIHIRESTLEAVYCAVESIYLAEGAKYGLRPHEIVADITGGLKTMTAGMLLACLPFECPIEYVASSRDAEGSPIAGTQQVVLLNPCPSAIPSGRES